MSQRLGISGSTARAFLVSEITPLLALVGFLLGVFAVLITPREEEPQINVTFANVFIAFPGASAKEVEDLVTSPAEQILSELEGDQTHDVTRTVAGAGAGGNRTFIRDIPNRIGCRLVLVWHNRLSNPRASTMFRS